MAVSVLLLGVSPFAAPQAAQPVGKYPERPIRLIVPAPPSGATDLMGRIVGSGLRDGLGQQVVIDNRPGGGTVIATELAARASPDGYTLFLASAAFGTTPGLLKKLPYDSIKDFAPISLFAKSPLIFVVPLSLGVSSILDLIKLAKARPGQLNYGISGLGSGGHMSTELLLSMAGIDIVQIQYKGASQALLDLVSGRIQVVCTSPAPALPFVRQGKLRPIAMTGQTRWKAMPEIPTVAESVPGYESSLWYALLAPAGTSGRIIKRLNTQVAKLAKSPIIVKQLASQAAEPIGSTPEELAKFLKTDIDRWTKLIERAKITKD